MEQGRTSDTAARKRERGREPALDDAPARSGRGADSALAALKSREERRDRLRPAVENSAERNPD